MKKKYLIGVGVVIIGIIFFLLQRIFLGGESSFKTAVTDSTSIPEPPNNIQKSQETATLSVDTTAILERSKTEQAHHPCKKIKEIEGEIKDTLLDMVFVKGGTFLPDFNTFHPETKTVTANKDSAKIADFYLGKYEITGSIYHKVTGRRHFSQNEYSDRPVYSVLIEEVINFCNTLSRKENLPIAYDSLGNFLDSDGNITKNPALVKGYRLPTIFEWEFAAKGGIHSKGYYLAGGNSADVVGWYNANSKNKAGNPTPQPVGLKIPNELGIYDMSGNIEEMCNDIAYYRYALRKRIARYKIDTSDDWKVREARGSNCCCMGLNLPSTGSNIPIVNKGIQLEWGKIHIGVGFRIARSN